MPQIDFTDGRSLDEEAAKAIRQEWLYSRMNLRRSEFVSTPKIRVFCGTYNINAKKLEDAGLQAWLSPPTLPETESDAPDIYALGFQEIVDLNVTNVALDGSKTVQRSHAIADLVSSCLAGRKDRVKYKLVEIKYLVGLLLCIYVKASLVQAGDVRDVRTSAVAVGALGMGSKGGIAVSLYLYDSSLCFICSHLAAHREQVEARNADYQTIVDKSVFLAESHNATDVVDAWVDRPKLDYRRSAGRNVRIFDHDCVFWIGDLNYRIDSSLSTKQVFEVVNQYSQAAAKAGDLRNQQALEHLRQLSAIDQLNLERSKPNGPFPGFCEGPLLFKPTYKYQPGTADTFDTRNPKKLRAPAWCDRVLWWHSAGAEQVRLLAYDCVNLTPSDHKPVYAVCDFKGTKVRSDHEQRVYTELSNCLSSFRYGGTSQRSAQSSHSDFKFLGFTPVVRGDGYFPILELSSHLLRYKGLTYLSTASQSLRVTNIGAVLAPWRFVGNSKGALGDGAADASGPPSRRWVQVNPVSGLLLPGESVEITVTVTLDTITAQHLAARRELLNDELLLRCENGVEYSVGISCSHHRTCFGASLEARVASADPARVTAEEEDDEFMLQHMRDVERVRSVQGNGTNSAEISVAAAAVDLLGIESDFDCPVQVSAPPINTPPSDTHIALSAFSKGSALAVALVAQQPLIYNQASLSGAPMAVPIELWRLLHALQSKEALQWPGLFEYALGKC